MRSLVFASRNRKEILRDPLNLAFGIGFPLIILFLLSTLQANTPGSSFEIKNLAPGMVVFGLSFISLFSGMLIAKDRTTSFLMRLYTSPLSASDFILGYTQPLIPLAIGQGIICFLASFFLGLALDINVVLSLVVLLPTALLFIGFGLLAGSIFNEKQVGGICGALLTNLSAWLSGTWFDLKLIGGAYETIAYLLPFAHAVDATRAALTGNYGSIFPHLWWVIGYATVVMGIAVLVFNRQMKNDQA